MKQPFLRRYTKIGGGTLISIPNHLCSFHAPLPPLPAQPRPYQRIGRSSELVVPHVETQVGFGNPALSGQWIKGLSLHMVIRTSHTTGSPVVCLVLSFVVHQGTLKTHMEIHVASVHYASRGPETTPSVHTAIYTPVREEVYNQPLPF